MTLSRIPAVSWFATLVFLTALNSFPLHCQQATGPAVVPMLVHFSGRLTDVNGKPLSGVAGVTFYLFSEQDGGVPLWMETQNVEPDKAGHYSVMLGSTSRQGLPTNIFFTGEARWLGVQVQGQAEQPRVLLLSVPYALKAGDASTVGGLPPSAFVLAAPSAASSNTSPGTASSPTESIGGTGTSNVIPLWTNSTTLGNSVLFQSGIASTAKLGINTTAPASTLDVKGGGTIRGTLSLPATATATASSGKNSQPVKLSASAFSSGMSAAVMQNFQWQAEPTGNDTSSPSGTMNLLFGQGSNTPAETGLRIAANGQISFAPGQTFPGTGSGTITAVTAGAGLSGGGSTGNVSLSVPANAISNSMLQNSAITLMAGTGLTGGGAVPLGGSATVNLDTNKVPQLSANNSFTGNQIINGNLTVLNNSTYQPMLVQSSNTFGTWLQLSNTSKGGQTWNILSAGGANSEGAGNLGISNLHGGTIWLEGPVNAGSYVSVASPAPTQIGTSGCTGAAGAVGFGANSLNDCAHYSLLGDTVNTFLNRPSGGQMLFRENNATEMVLASGGNLGIGTTTPSYLLHVNGTMRAETGLSLGGVATLSVDSPGVTGGQFLVSNGSVSIGGDTPMSHNPHMSFSSQFMGSLCNGHFNCGAGNGANWGGYIVPDHNIMITRFTGTLNESIDPSCPTTYIQVDDFNSSQSLADVPLPSGVYYFDSGSLSISAPAGHRIWAGVVPSIDNSCNLGASAGGDVYINVQYVMQ